jgi:hypothetical protein
MSAAVIEIPSRSARMRELLRQGRMSPAEAARELHIDEATFRLYWAGKPVPRYVLLALEQLVYLERLRQ